MTTTLFSKRPLLVSLYWFITLGLAVAIRRITIPNVYPNFWVDTIFTYSVLVLVIGLIIHLANTSRRHYYRHVQNQQKGLSLGDEAFHNDEHQRTRFAHTGKKIALTGVVGVAISATLFLLT